MSESGLLLLLKSIYNQFTHAKGKLTSDPDRWVCLALFIDLSQIQVYRFPFSMVAFGFSNSKCSLLHMRYKFSAMFVRAFNDFAA